MSFGIHEPCIEVPDVCKKFKPTVILMNEGDKSKLMSFETLASEASSGSGEVASPATALFVLAGLFGVAALYFGYLAYARGGKHAEMDFWQYGFIATFILGLDAAYITFSRIGAVPEYDVAHAVGLFLISFFLMVSFKKAADFFE